MNTLAFSLLVACMTFAVFSSNVLACTGIRLIAEDGGAVVGRTMEFGFDVHSNVVVVPAGTQLTSSLADQSTGMHYTSKYGMVGANIMGKHVIVDGVNEKGLYVGGFYFPGYASYPDHDPEKASQSLAPEDYGTWLLANFASVEEVRAHFNDAILVPNPIAEIGGESFPGHYVVHDGTGASVVIEPVDKMLKIHDNPLGL